MVVGAADGKLRFWRNTSVADLAAGPDGHARHETSSATSGTRTSTTASGPPGLIRLSHDDRAASTGAPGLRLARYGAGTATHTLTLYRAPSGALVFGAGTVQWSWGLDGNHDSGPARRPTPRMQQATVNLFADMGVQPATLQPGLRAATASTDTTAPTVDHHRPGGRRQLPVGHAGHHHRHRHRHRRRRVGGVEVSIDSGATWRRATGRASWTYTWTPPRPGAVDHARPGRRRQRQHRDAAAPAAVTVGSAAGRAARARSGPARATPAAHRPGHEPVEVGVKFRASTDGFITGIRFYKGVADHRHPRRHAVDRHRHPARPPRPSPAKRRPAGSRCSFATPVPVTAEHHLRRLLLRPDGRYSRRARGYFATSGDHRGPLTALARRRRGGNGVYRYGAAAGTFPDQHLADARTTGSTWSSPTAPTPPSRR